MANFQIASSLSITTIHKCENEFNLHVDEISFSYDRMETMTRFKKEAKGNSEMVWTSDIYL